MRILMKIDSTNQDSKWEALAPMEYSHEAELQGLLNTGSAELIPADPSLEEAHVVFAREVSTDSGPIDLIGIGSSGSVTIMECKLARNHQIKREVVGQVLDYAASLWETDLPALSEAFRARAGSDPFEAIRQQFGEDAESFDEAACRSEVARRLREGDFRLLVAVDRIDPELRRIIQYVNSRGGSEPGLRLVAVEFPRYQQGMIQVLVPEAYGDELAQHKPPHGGRRWVVEDYFAALAPDSPVAPIVRRLLDWAAERRLTVRMGHGQTPSPSWRLDALGADYPLFAVDVGGKLWLSLGTLRVRPVSGDGGVVRTLTEALNAIPEIKVAHDASGPAVPLLPLTQEQAFAAFTAAWDRVIDAVRAAESREEPPRRGTLRAPTWPFEPAHRPRAPAVAATGSTPDPPSSSPRPWTGRSPGGASPSNGTGQPVGGRLLRSGHEDGRDHADLLVRGASGGAFPHCQPPRRGQPFIPAFDPNVVSRAEIREHGQHASLLRGLGPEPELLEDPAELSDCSVPPPPLGVRRAADGHGAN